jgi:conjugative transfer pilus assembly protein TraH
MFAGSFSFINGAQFTQLARSIAQAAVGYAFQLAIEGMCPTCAQVISKLQSEIAKINALMRNSCEAGKAIVNATGLQNWSKERRREASSINTGLGFVDDYFNSEEANASSPTQVLIQNGKSDEITGNVVYEALTESNAASWFVSGDDQIKMTLMSLTGTLIISKIADGTDVQYDFRQPIVKVRDLIEGGSIEIYKCESGECLLPSGGEKETITIQGMRSRAKAMVWGTGPQATGTGGIIRKMTSRNTGDAFTSDEQKFIEASSPGVYGLLRGMATEMQSAGLVADRLVDVVASELTNRIVEEMYGVVDNAVKGTGRPLDSSMLAVMRDVRDQIKEERRITGESIAGINSLIQLQGRIKESLRTPMNNKVH